MQAKPAAHKQYGAFPCPFSSFGKGQDKAGSIYYCFHSCQRKLHKR